MPFFDMRDFFSVVGVELVNQNAKCMSQFLDGFPRRIAASGLFKL